MIRDDDDEEEEEGNFQTRLNSYMLKRLFGAEY
jgi:hypothetical protein